MTWINLLELLRSSTTPEQIDSQRDEIAEWIPAVQVMFHYDQNNKYHQYDLWMHSIHTMLGIPKGMEDDMLYLAALLHDIGKPRCRSEGGQAGDKSSHYYGHQDVSAEIVSEQVIPYIFARGGQLSHEDSKRLIYYIKYHDDRVSLRPKHLLRHLNMVDLDTFKKLMLLEVADAKAHVLHPVIQERIDVCTKWANGYADEVKREFDV